MVEETEPIQASQPGLQWQVWWRQARQQLTYLALTLTGVVLVALALSLLAVVLQSRRDEARNADLGLVVVAAQPTAAVADHAFELYRRGYVPKLVLAGEGREMLKALLVERGIPEAQLVLIGETDQPENRVIQAFTQEAHASGVTSLLMVTEPAATLTDLKIARDQGLRAYGSPAPASATNTLSLLVGSLRYWQYTLLGL